MTLCNIAAGLDIDALRDVANAVNGLKTDKTATLMVTHYKRLLNYIKPEHVHVMEVRSAAPHDALSHHAPWCHQSGKHHGLVVALYSARLASQVPPGWTYVLNSDWLCCHAAGGEDHIHRLNRCGGCAGEGRLCRHQAAHNRGRLMSDKSGPVFDTVVSGNEQTTAAKHVLNESSFTTMAHLP